MWEARALYGQKPRWAEPHKFVIEKEPSTTKQFIQIYFFISDALSYYQDSTEKEDVFCIAEGRDFIDYEMMRLSVLEDVSIKADDVELKAEEEVSLFQNIKPEISNINVLITQVKSNLHTSGCKELIWQLMVDLLTIGESVLPKLKKWNISPKSRYIE